MLNVGTLPNSWSFIFGVSNWKFCNVGYPVGPQKPDIQMRTFLTWDYYFFMLLFFSEKKSKPVGYTNTVFANWEKYGELKLWCLLLIFKVVYRDHLTQLLPFTRDFIVKGHQLVWGQVG